MLKIFKFQLGSVLLVITIIIGITSLSIGALYFSQQLKVDREDKEPEATSSPTTQTAKPDLIIGSISYHTAPISQDEHGMPSLSPGKKFEFNLRVKNIGSGSLNDRFYISNTRSAEDLSSNYYSHTQMANAKKKSLKPGETLEVKIIDSINQDVPKVRFLINPEGSKGTLPSRIEEANYKNNTYGLTID